MGWCWCRGLRFAAAIQNPSVKHLECNVDNIKMPAPLCNFLCKSVFVQHSPNDIICKQMSDNCQKCQRLTIRNVMVTRCPAPAPLSATAPELLERQRTIEKEIYSLVCYCCGVKWNHSINITSMTVKICILQVLVAIYFYSCSTKQSG